MEEIFWYDPEIVQAHKKGKLEQVEAESSRHSLDDTYQSIMDEYMPEEGSKPTAAPEPATVASDPPDQSSRHTVDPAEVIELARRTARKAENTGNEKRTYSKRDCVELLPNNVEYLRIRSKHHRNQEFTWAVVAILSEIYFFMKEKGAACFASTRHLAAVARITMGTCRNLLRSLTADAIIIPLGIRIELEKGLSHRNIPTFQN
jgi:hypothetical protein